MAGTVSKDQMSHEPDLNRLAALVEGRLTGVERQDVLSHLAACRTCRSVVAVLTNELRPSLAATRWTRPAVWLPIAASLTIAAVGGLLVSTTDRSTPMPPPAPPPGVERPLPLDRAPTAPDVRPPSRPTQGNPEDLSRRRSGTRQVGTKTFRLVAGEWIDSIYDPGALLPLVAVAAGDDRRDLLTRIPALAPYAAVGDRLIVVHEGVVYRFGAVTR